VAARSLKEIPQTTAIIVPNTIYNEKDKARLRGISLSVSSGLLRGSGLAVPIQTGREVT